MKRINLAPVSFLALFFGGLFFSKMSVIFVLNEVITRFIRDAVLVLALVLPIIAGMGINFAIVVGAMCAQAGMLFIIIAQINGIAGFVSAAFLGIGFSAAVGYLVGRCLNRVKGKEMIATIVIGMLANGVYQLVFLVGYGTVIPAHNREILLSTGKGVRSMVDLADYRNILDRIWVVELGDVTIPVFMVLLVLAFCSVVAYFVNTRIGQQIKAVGQDTDTAEVLGIDVNRIRITVMILSLAIACLGQMIYLQNIGMFSVYTAHGNSDIISAAAILAGGATIKEARVRHVILGVFLFHSLFIVSPQAGQHIFGNAALGEYFRSFVAYATITVALILNLGTRTVPPLQMKVKDQ